MSQILDRLDEIIASAIVPEAIEVDRVGAFPASSMDALKAAGFLGLISSTEVGGGGKDMECAAEVVKRVSGACGSTGMVLLMHYSATAILEAHGPKDVREAIAVGDHLTTLAFSEQGSRSHFWAPVGTASETDGGIVALDAKKSWVTAAAAADSYVWSSRPLAQDTDGVMSLWLVPTSTRGLEVATQFDGLGLRGNGSVPVTAHDVRIPADARLGDDGTGLEIALATALPCFLLLSGAFGIGLMEAVTSEVGEFLATQRLEHIDERLIAQPLSRIDYARMRVSTDAAIALLRDTVAAIAANRDDAVLRVLEIKASVAESAIAVTDLAMKICGGAAFRKELGVERRFRDARASRVMAPTTDALLDFIGRAISGLPLIGPVS